MNVKLGPDEDEFMVRGLVEFKQRALFMFLGTCD